MRWRDELHSINGKHIENTPFVLIVLRTRMLRNRFRIGIQLWAGFVERAMRAPLRAFCISEVCAMARKSPTIMQRPTHLTRLRCQPLEKHLNINIVAMDVMQMHNIGLDFIEPFEEPGCISFRIETHPVEQTRLHSMRKVAKLCSTALLTIVYGFMTTSPKNVRVHTSFR